MTEPVQGLWPTTIPGYCNVCHRWVGALVKVYRPSGIHWNCSQCAPKQVTV